MVLFIDADIELFGPARFTVGGNNSLRVEIRGSCAGGSVTVYSTDLNIMYYALRYCSQGVIMNIRGRATMRAWISDTHCARPRLSGTCDFIKRERSRVNNEVLPSLVEFAEAGLDPSDLTKYAVLRFVGSHWATPNVLARAGRTLDQFIVPLQEMHNSLVSRGLLEEEELVRGEVNLENAVEEEDARTEAERLRLELARAATARVSVSSLPASFLRLDNNVSAPRMNNISSNSNTNINSSSTTIDDPNDMRD